MFSKSLFSKILLLGFSLFMSSVTNATLTPVGDLIQVSITINGNDCSGYFGTDPSCDITHVQSLGTNVYASFMGKFDTEKESDNAFANGFSKNNWTFNGSSDHKTDNRTSGTWAYTAGLYPGVSFWTAKGGPEFTLNWMIDKTNEHICNSVIKSSSESCLSLAVAVNEGSWLTPDNPNNGKNYGLSHISFYGKKCDSNCEPKQQVPEPTSIALLALALFGIAAKRKKFTL